MKKTLSDWLIKDLITEDVKLDLKVGDTILMGRFKNKKVKVKSIDYNEKGDLLINGRPALKFRLAKNDRKLLPNKQPSNKDAVNPDADMKGVKEAARQPRKKGQHRNSSSHSDLYTDENPKGTIHGLKFATVKDAKASVNKIKGSGKKHAHKIQAAVAMEQRAKEMGKKSAAGVYRKFINQMKEKTKKKNEMLNQPNYARNVANVPGIQTGGEHRYYNPETSKKKKKKKTEKIQPSTHYGFYKVVKGKKIIQYRGSKSDVRRQLKKVRKQDPKGKYQLIAGGGKVGSIFEVVPSPSRKGVEKMKKKGNTSVPYGSGYKKVNEANAVSGGKVSKFITGHNLTMKGKKYKEIEFETLGVDNSSKMVKLRILAPKNLFGMETPVKFQTLRRGPFTKTETGKKVNEDETKTIQSLLQRFGNSEKDAKKMIKKNYKKVNKKFKGQTPRDKAMALIGLSLLGEKNINKVLDSYMKNVVYSIVENTQIKKVIGIYGGRFQPFGPHHLKTYQWLESRVDEAYITTSDIKKPPRHPMNFGEKVRHMTKMGVPKGKIIKEATPYVAKNTLSKFDPETTAVVYIFGKKDAGRLQGGTKKSGGKTYYQDYKQNKNNLVGFEEHGYILTAPHTSMNVAGMEISGTTMRKILGSPKIKDEDRPKVFKKLFGYYDEGIYKMLTNKFKGLVDHIIPDKKIEEFLMKEGSVSVPNLSDEGLYDFFKSYDDYERVSPKHANILAGFEVIGHLIDKKDVMENDFTYEYERTPTVTFGRTVNQNTKNYASSDNPFPKHISYMKELANTMGMKILKFIGTENKGVGGQKVDGVIESEIDFYLGLDEQLDIYTKEIVEVLSNEDYKGKELLLMGGAYGHMAHPFDDKNLTFGDIKNIIDLGLQGKLDAEAGVQEKLDGQNLMISWKGKNLVVARNKGDIKRGGASVGSIKAKFKGRGNIEKAFSYALDDLSKSIGKLTDAQKKKIFDDGNNYMNLEVMYPASANVINYDAPIIVFHGALKYRGGEAIGEVPGSGRILAGMIKQIGANIGKKFSIRGPNVLKMTKSQDYSKQRAYFFAKLDRLRNQYKLSDSDKLSVYHQHYWLEWILNGANQTDYPNPPDNVVYALMKRWAFFDKSYTVPMIKRDLKEHPKFLDWVLSTDKQDHSKMVKKNMKPFETLFFEVGAEILKNLSGFLAVNPKASVQNVKKQVEKAINVVKKGGDLKKLNTLKAQMEKLNAIGGLGAVVPTEGLVFKYNGNVYKLTGAFAPINQITGLMYF